MAEDFTILVLADTHIGKSRSHIDSLEVLRPLMSDIRATITEHDLHVGAIIFAGDLAFGAIPEGTLREQYSIATDFLKDACTAAGGEFGQMPILLAPGNHDIDRNMIDDIQKDWSHSHDSKRDLVEYVDEMMQKNNITWRHFLERQHVWWNFAKSLPGNFWHFDDQLHISHGIITSCGRKLGIVPLHMKSDS